MRFTSIYMVLKAMRHDEITYVVGTDRKNHSKNERSERGRGVSKINWKKKKKKVTIL